jgi:putative membrane protein
MYLWIKTLHIVAVISWMAGLLYLPRLFVYHCEAEMGSRQSETFKVMERRLLRAIMTPAMVVTWATGLWMASQAGFFQAGWLHAKLTLVLMLTVVHFHFWRLQNGFAGDLNPHPQRYYRIWNEIPTVLMIFIVGVVVLKPSF